MNKLKLLIVFLLITILHSAAFADVLIDTGTPTNTSLQWSFHGNPTSEVWHAGLFSLDQSYFLTDISLYLTPYYDGTVTVSIYPGDVVPVVGSELLSDTFLGTTGGPTGWYGISELNWEVSSGSYWVAFEAREKDYYYSTLPSAAPSPMEAYAAYNGGWFLTPNAGTGIRISGEVVPVPISVTVDIDIKPGSCPNPLNVKSKGVLPVAVLGSEDFDVFSIDPASIRLAGVAPIRSSYEDVATPVSDSEDDCACTTEGPDGYVDIILQFDTQEIVAAIGNVSDDDLLVLTLTGEDLNGVPIEGTDCVVIIAKGKQKAVITSVVRDGVTEGQPEIVAGPSPSGLQEGSHAFMDRPLDESDTRNYHWEGIPAELVGADYVMTYNEDKQPWLPEVYNVSYAVTLGKAAKLYIFVDDRYAPFAWLTDGSAGAVFADTGLDIMLNEVGGREVLQPYDVYGAEVSAGTYILGPSCDGDGNRSFYSIAAAKL